MATARELLAAARAGAEILHNGAPAVYWPSGARDRRPWAVYADGRIHRYTSAQCSAYFPARSGRREQP